MATQSERVANEGGGNVQRISRLLAEQKDVSNEGPNYF